jgi:hypothetical protein
MGDVLGLENGVVGMLAGAVAGLLIMLQAWKTQPWDIHDEKSYAEPKRITLGAVTPSLVMLGALLTLLLGLGALDQGIDPKFAISGDILGVLLLPWSAIYVFKGIP